MLQLGPRRGPVPPRTPPERCGTCAGEHTTRRHGCPMQGGHGRQGRTCAHATLKCANCRGPHLAIANECRMKAEARQAAVGWSPSPPRREGKGPLRRPSQSPHLRMPRRRRRGRRLRDRERAGRRRDFLFFLWRIWEKETGWPYYAGSAVLGQDFLFLLQNPLLLRSRCHDLDRSRVAG